MSETPEPGKLLSDDDRQRDAIHVALAPATAATRLTPGEHVGLVRADDAELAGPTDNNIGIVDPFLAAEVEPGQRFWLFLYPNSVTGLRHIWTHPTFNAVASEVRAREEAVSEPVPAQSLRDDFLAALAENEDDAETRLVFSDWLDEQGEHEEAERHRKWPAAKKWLVEFVQANNEDEDEDDPYLTVITYDDLIAFGRSAIEENDYWLSCGSNDLMCDALREKCEEFWKNWSIITGVPVPADAVEQSSFSCAC